MTHWKHCLHWLCRGMAVCIVSGAPARSVASPPDASPSLQIPTVLNYQGQLTDGGGTPRSGPAMLTFRITDDTRNILFEEAQQVELPANGAVSALIGNGTSPANGAASGGVAREIFTPGSPRFLEVWVGNEMADDPLEIVSVPYAYHSDTAWHVATGGVDAAAIADGALAMSHFSTALVDELAAAVMQSSAFHAPEGAEAIGVTTTFAYSGAKTVQGVLQDLDKAIKAREEKNVSRGGDTMTGALHFVNGATTTLTIEATTGTVDGVDVGAHAQDQAAHGADGPIVGANTLAAHTDAITGHGADGAIVGENRLATELATRLSKAGDFVHGNLTFINGAGINGLPDPVLPHQATSRQFVQETCVDAIGDHLTGSLTFENGAGLYGLPEPVEGHQAATKSYVDNGFLSAKGAFMSGHLMLINDATINGLPDPVLPHQATSKKFVQDTCVDAIGDYLTGNLTFQNGATINGLPDPVLPHQATSKKFVLDTIHATPRIMASGVADCNGVGIGSTCPITAVHNIAQVVRLNAGSAAAYEVTFGSALSNANYAVQATFMDPIAANSPDRISIGTRTTGAVQIHTISPHAFSITVVML